MCMSEEKRVTDLEEAQVAQSAAFWKLVEILLKKKVISTDDEVTITEAQEEA